MEGSDAVVWTDGYAIVAPHGPTTLPKRLHVPPTRAGLMPQKVRSGHGVRGAAGAITKGAAALQVCCTHPNAVLYQPVVSGGHVSASLACVRVH